MPKQDDRYVIPSVVRALQILEAFSFQKSTYTNSELSRKLDINKSSVTRLLSSLEKAKFLRRNKETGRYYLTHKSYQVGRVYIKQVDVHKVSMPILEELTSKCQEVSFLGILDELQVLYLDWVESKQTVSLPSMTGMKLPAYCTGNGKNFLAHMDEKTLSAYFKNIEMVQHTVNTITNPEVLKKQLKQVKKQGYACDFGEYHQDVISVSAPVYNDVGEIIAGISIAGPEFRLGKDILHKKIIPELKKAALNISRQLGF
jgi:IclR family KDG regulon transcriptional repressor